LNQNSGWLTRTFSHIELAQFSRGERSPGESVNWLTRIKVTPFRCREGRSILEETRYRPSNVTMDLRVLKYFPFGGLRRLTWLQKPSICLTVQRGSNQSWYRLKTRLPSQDSVNPSRGRVPAKFSSRWILSSDESTIRKKPMRMLSQVC